MSKARTSMLRRNRLSTEWSLANAKLGGREFQYHPVCATINRYIHRAPYGVPSREWSRFRRWMQKRVQAAEQIWPAGEVYAGSSWGTEWNRCL